MIGIKEPEPFSSARNSRCIAVAKATRLHLHKSVILSSKVTSSKLKKADWSRGKNRLRSQKVFTDNVFSALCSCQSWGPHYLDTRAWEFGQGGKILKLLFNYILMLMLVNETQAAKLASVRPGSIYDNKLERWRFCIFKLKFSPLRPPAFCQLLTNLNKMCPVTLHHWG